MGDRCYCSLYLKNEPTPELIEILDEELGEPDDQEGLFFGYSEVNWAQLPKPVLDYCREHKLPFAWINDAGDSYGPSAVIFDGETSDEWPMMDDEIVIILSLASPEHIANATRWQEVLSSIRRA